MTEVLRALSVSESGLAQMSKTDKACCLMEWNDSHQNSFQSVSEVLCHAGV